MASLTSVEVSEMGRPKPSVTNMLAREEVVYMTGYANQALLILEAAERGRERNKEERCERRKEG